jgi:hypothetical protein
MIVGGAPEKHMKSQIERIFIDQAPADGPRLVVVETDQGGTPLERYRQGRHNLPLRAGNLLALIIRSTPLSSADLIKITSAEWRENRVIVALESRRYTGAFSGNDVMIGFIELILGSCDPGRYEAVVTEVELEFTELDHPDQAVGASSTTDLLSFNVAMPKSAVGGK